MHLRLPAESHAWCRWEAVKLQMWGGGGPEPIKDCSLENTDPLGPTGRLRPQIGLAPLGGCAFYPGVGGRP